MKCARLHLQQRSKGKTRIQNPPLVEKPRRYCQKRLINPAHEEDPRWIDIFDRFHCNMNSAHLTDVLNSVQAQDDAEDIVLTVQTLKFQGDVNQTKRPRTSFKYKKSADGNKHRMFVKQAVTENSFSDDDRSSEQTYYYFDDYVKYLCNNDRSRPTSGKSSLFLRGFSKEKVIDNKANKATQVESIKADQNEKIRRSECKIKNFVKKPPKRPVKDEIKDIPENIENAKITYQKSGKRKSLTISRAQSPETVQIIRVDVVRNYNSSSTSDYEENKKVECSTDRSEPKRESTVMKRDYFAKNHFAHKYLLTNTIKSLDENLSGGAKVTLLCKTFKLSDRTKTPDPQGILGKKYTKTQKNNKKVNKIKKS